MELAAPLPVGAEGFDCFAFRAFDAARVEDVLAERTRAMAVGAFWRNEPERWRCGAFWRNEPRRRVVGW